MKETQLQNKNSTNSFHQQTVLFESHPKKSGRVSKTKEAFKRCDEGSTVFLCICFTHDDLRSIICEWHRKRIVVRFCLSVLDHKSLCLFSHIYSNCILCGLTLNNGPGSMRLRRAFDSLSFVLSISIRIFVSILFCLILLRMADFFI